VDRIADRFGTQSIVPASTLRRGRGKKGAEGQRGRGTEG